MTSPAARVPSARQTTRPGPLGQSTPRYGSARLSHAADEVGFCLLPSRKILRRRRNPIHQTGQRAGERPKAPKGRSSVAGGVNPRTRGGGRAPLRRVRRGRPQLRPQWGFRRPFGDPRTEHPWASGSRGLTPPAIDGRPFGAKKTNFPNGLARLSARRPSVGSGVASAVNNLARGEKGRPARFWGDSNLAPNRNWFRLVGEGTPALVHERSSSAEGSA